MRRTALIIDQALVLATPVDKGVARSNWLVSLGASRGDVISAYSRGSKLGISEGANAQGAIQHALSVVGNHKVGQDIYITNNVHYIETLNAGYSGQAPANFVALAIQAGIEAIRRNPGILKSRNSPFDGGR